MRIVLKREYNDYIKVFDRPIKWCWVALLLILLFFIPFFGGTYFLSLMTMAGFYTIIGLSLILLTGLAGRISLGHAAFYAVGAYSSCIFVSKLGLPFLLAMILSGGVACMVGLVVGIPSLRLKDLYLAIATMAMAFIIEDVITKWESLTGGTFGLSVPPASIGGFVFDTEPKYYYLVMVIVVITMMLAKNIQRSGYGRALAALRESEIAAQAMGINITYYKIIIFGLSAFYTGIAGSLYAHYAGFIAPENFTFFMSINFLVLIIVGGLGSVVGAVLGGLYMSLIPEGVKIITQMLPGFLEGIIGLDLIFYALILLAFISYQPEGFHGLWLKMKFYWDHFPLYKKGTFRKERKFYRKKIK